MISPFANFFYFGVLIFVIVPTMALGFFGRANARWTLFATVLMLCIHSSEPLMIRQRWLAPELAVALVYLLYQGALAAWLRSSKSRVVFYLAVLLGIAPLIAAKFFPVVRLDHGLGFLGISYVTFRALDVLFSIRDGVVTSLSPGRYFAFLFFFPTVSSGPVDRLRRFSQDWQRSRGRVEFLNDLEVAVQRIFRGFFYKFILAALIKKHWLDHVSNGGGSILELASSMYAYSLYLFFDFAGYSAFAIGVSYLFGIRTPENFNLPFLARNIRDFWNRWHISLSFWFRDHVYMRFLLAAAKGKWFRGKHTASYVGLFLTFGLMGLWHGTQFHYILYGLYHATLLSGYDAFARWNKKRKVWGEGRWWRCANIVITFHAVCLGLLLFSGRLTVHARGQGVTQASSPDRANGQDGR
jgi:membrane protein involved in D-alanine export